MVGYDGSQSFDGDVVAITGFLVGIIIGFHMPDKFCLASFSAVEIIKSNNVSGE